MLEILLGAAAIAAVSAIGIYSDKKAQKNKKTPPSRGSRGFGDYERIFREDK